MFEFFEKQMLPRSNYSGRLPRSTYTKDKTKDKPKDKPVCETCKGTRKITMWSAIGRRIRIPCPDC